MKCEEFCEFTRWTCARGMGKKDLITNIFWLKIVT